MQKPNKMRKFVSIHLKKIELNAHLLTFNT